MKLEHDLPSCNGDVMRTASDAALVRTRCLQEAWTPAVSDPGPDVLLHILTRILEDKPSCLLEIRCRPVRQCFLSVKPCIWQRFPV